MSSTSNIDELIAVLKTFQKDVFKSQALYNHSMDVADFMKQSVINNLNSSPYDYDQTGNLRQGLDYDPPEVQVNSTGSKIIMAYGSLSYQNSVKRKAMSAFFLSPNGTGTYLTFQAERELPEWVIAEFGRHGGSGVDASDVPTWIRNTIDYNPRPDKDLLIGPSASNPNNIKRTRFFTSTTSAISRKPIFFMASEAMAESMGIYEERFHPGIQAGHIFSRVMFEHKQTIFNLVYWGVREAVQEFATKFGWRVE